MSLDFSGLTLPFTAEDVLGAGNALLQYVGPFILLGIAFIIVPKLYNMIKGALSSRSKAN